MQAIMDHWKWFWNVYVGIPSSIKNAWILVLFSYTTITKGNLFVVDHGQENIKTYILKDKGYPMLPWLMVFHKQVRECHIAFKTLYNW